MQLSDLNNEAHINALLSIVKRHCGHLPKSGILAGQAVASAIMQYLESPMSGPFNDADVFMYSMIQNSEMVDMTSRVYLNKGKASSLEIGVVTNYGIEEDVVLEKDMYQIHNVSHWADNLKVNIIDISTQILDTPKEYIDCVISGFDFNVCQAGICLETNTLSYTPEFEAFLNNQEIKPSFLGTPVHSLYRGFKKQRDIVGAYLDGSTLITVMGTARMCFYHLENMKSCGLQYTVGQLHTLPTEQKWLECPEMVKSFSYVDEHIYIDGKDERNFISRRKAIPIHYDREVVNNIASLCCLFSPSTDRVDWLLPIITTLIKLQALRHEGCASSIHKWDAFSNIVLSLKQHAFNTGDREPVRSLLIHLLKLWNETVFLADRPLALGMLNIDLMIVNTLIVTNLTIVKELHDVARVNHFFNVLIKPEFWLLHDFIKRRKLEKTEVIALFTQENVADFYQAALIKKHDIEVNYEAKVFPVLPIQCDIDAALPAHNIVPVSSEMMLLQACTTSNVNLFEIVELEERKLSAYIIDSNVIVGVGFEENDAGFFNVTTRYEKLLSGGEVSDDVLDTLRGVFEKHINSDGFIAKHALRPTESMFSDNIPF